MPQTLDATIHSIFVEQLRNVVLVDDQYPSFAELAAQVPLDAGLRNERENASATYRYFQEKGLNCDIENDPSLESGRSDRLLRSDLLVLDYHLDVSDPSDGTRGLALLRALAGAPRYKCSILNTGAGDLHQVLAEIYVRLAGTAFSKLPGLDQAEVDELDDLDPLLVRNLARGLSWELAVRAAQADPSVLPSVVPDLYQEISRYSSRSDPVVALGNPSRVVGSVVAEKFRPYLSQSEPCREVRAAINGGILWIEADNLFLVLIKKSPIQNDLLKSLSLALVDRNPNPVEVLLAGIRNLISEEGFEISRTLGSGKTDASWLHHALTNPATTPKGVEEFVGNIVTEFGMRVRAIAKDRSSAIIETFAARGVATLLKDYYSIDVAVASEIEELYLFLNAYYCATSVRHQHLTTGVVLFGNNEYWLVTNNSCDMEPDQGSWYRKIRPLRPFTAVQLTLVGNGGKLLREGKRKLTDGDNVVFLQDGVPKVCRFGTDQGSLHYETFFAEEGGSFVGGVSKCHIVAYQGGQPQLKECSFKPVAQLRYEYASRLLNILSSHQSRIGVDFFLVPKATP